jgi:hypothetical protein
MKAHLFSISLFISGFVCPAHAAELFTVDKNGAIVGHAKYSGELCIRILQSINQLKK